jgi:hypothetical protein
MFVGTYRAATAREREATALFPHRASTGDVEKKVRKAAKASKQPLSRWISEQLMRGVESGWPREGLD